MSHCPYRTNKGKADFFFQKKMNKYSGGLIIVDMKNICFRSLPPRILIELWEMGLLQVK